MIGNRLLIESAQMTGELGKMLLALVIVALFACVAVTLQWACDRFGIRVVRWLVMAAIILAAFGIATLHAVDLL
jgi:hypothetical protein